MGIALCHTLPRDALVRVAALLATIAALLQFIAVVDAANDHRMGWLTLSTTPLGDLKATPWEIYASSGRVCPPPSGTSIVVHTLCDDFRKAAQAAVALTGTSCALTVVLCLIVGCGVVRHSTKSTRMLVAFTACFAMPFILSIASCSVVGDAMKSRLTKFGDEISTTSSSWKYNDGGALNISACVMYGLGIVLVSAKLILFTVENKALKEEVRKEAQTRAPHEDTQSHTSIAVDHDIKVNERLALRLVNDDWERQKQIWLERRKAVLHVLRRSNLDTRDARLAFMQKSREGTSPAVVSNAQPEATPAVTSNTEPDNKAAFSLEEVTPEAVQRMHHNAHAGQHNAEGTPAVDSGVAAEPVP
jgi:hypothetical protein